MDEELSILFDEFRDHIGEECAKGANQTLTTEEYSPVRDRYAETGGRYVQIRLQNVQTGDRSLIDSVERFRNDTKLKSVPHPETGMLLYTAFVPLSRPYKAKHHHHHRGSKRRGATASIAKSPRVEELYKWLMALCLLLVAIAYTTTWDQWSFIHQYFL